MHASEAKAATEAAVLQKSIEKLEQYEEHKKAVEDIKKRGVEEAAHIKQQLLGQIQVAAKDGKSAAYYYGECTNESNGWHYLNAIAEALTDEFVRLGYEVHERLKHNDTYVEGGPGDFISYSLTFTVKWG